MCLNAWLAKILKIRYLFDLTKRVLESHSPDMNDVI